MPQLILLKRPKPGVDRDELIEYLKTVHGPRISKLPKIREYTLYVQVDPDEADDLPEGLEYYDSSETIPVDDSETEYDTMEIQDYRTMDDLLTAHSSEQSQEAETGLHDVIDFEDEVAFVVREESIDPASN